VIHDRCWWCRQRYLVANYKGQGCIVCGLYAIFAGGGLFIPTNKTYKLGEEIFMLLTLMEEPEKLPLAGKVVWITPKEPRATGQPVWVCNSMIRIIPPSVKIETYLAGSLESDRATHTM
jgi:type IV pilus assembly protein PilZ